MRSAPVAHRERRYTETCFQVIATKPCGNINPQTP
jgi:hypothetical protein